MNKGKIFIKDLARQAYRDQQSQDTEGGCGEPIGFIAGYLDGFKAAQNMKDKEIESWVSANKGQAKTINQLILALKEIRDLDWGTDHCDAKNMIADDILNKIKELK